MSILVDLAVCLSLLPILGAVGAALGRAALMAAGLACLAHRLRGSGPQRGRGRPGEELAELGRHGAGGDSGAGRVDGLLLPAYVAVGAAAYLSMLRTLCAVTAQDVSLARGSSRGAWAGRSTSSRVLGVPKLDQRVEIGRDDGVPLG